MKTTYALMLATSLLAAPALAQPRGPEGNTQSGAAMDRAAAQSGGTGQPGAATPQPQLHSPAPPGASDTQARHRPEGNLGSGAAMSGAQSQSQGTSPNTGTTVPSPATQSPRR
ncbi:hypothetical protein [Paracraurococcus ruber]|uniref:Proteophosphoglycan ppg4 n=1 Tax=Paracraurococcus ruber TaxID=77675 RepID=A0ABS1CW77_9PROT|nr:hypothetical protein [Paracraurococcus ruber]MBK1658767.1 hypothetical protein [Paracraurococcus ruber]TDG32050.1 hypothetical protein E2C05_08835 [Paracraurococcus ruber]